MKLNWNYSKIGACYKTKPVAIDAKIAPIDAKTGQTVKPKRQPLQNLIANLLFPNDFTRLIRRAYYTSAPLLMIPEPCPPLLVVPGYGALPHAGKRGDPFSVPCPIQPRPAMCDWRYDPGPPEQLVPARSGVKGRPPLLTGQVLRIGGVPHPTDTVRIAGRLGLPITADLPVIRADGRLYYPATHGVLVWHPKRKATQDCVGGPGYVFHTTRDALARFAGTPLADYLRDGPAQDAPTAEPRHFTL